MKDLESFTLRDWIAASREESRASFGMRKTIARISGIPVPYAVAGKAACPVISLDFPADKVARMVRLEDRQALRQFNRELKGWCDKVRRDLQRSVTLATLGTPSKGHAPGMGLFDTLDYYIKKDEDYHREPVRVGFRFARHGVHLHHGSGRGQGGAYGSHWIDQHGVRRETDPESLGKAGTGKRKPRDWFNPVLDRNLKELTDICARYCADMVVNSDYLYLGL